MPSEDRILIDPRIMLGKPVIRGTRITVEILLEKLAAGSSFEELLRDYPSLTMEDLRAALAYARASLRSEEVIPYSRLAS